LEKEEEASVPGREGIDAERALYPLAKGGKGEKVLPLSKKKDCPSVCRPRKRVLSVKARAVKRHRD